MRLISAGVISFLGIILCSVVNPAFGQSIRSAIHQMTTPPSDARFEIVQSPLAVRWTFRLDRYTGRVYQLVKTQKGGVTWQSMLIQRRPEASNPTKPKFVIFASGLAARSTYLMDSDTGQTWVLTTFDLGGESLNVTGWRPLEQ